MVSEDIRRKLSGLKEEIGIEDDDVKEVIALAIELANKYIDYEKVRERIGIKEDRSLLLRIIDVPGECGFIIVGNKVKPVIGIEKATTYVEMTKDVFWAIVSKKLSLYDAWLYDLVKIRGEYSLRDAQILIPLFELLYDYLFEGEEG